MVSRIDVQKSYMLDKETVKAGLNHLSTPVNLIETSEVIDIMMAEGGEELYNYIKLLGLANDSNLVVLSSQRHYYYEEDDLKNVSTVINLKPLNQIKNLNVLLQSTYNLIPQESNFVGCFVENKKLMGYFVNDTSATTTNNIHSEALEEGIVSTIPFLNMIYSFIDSKTNRNMTRKSVNLLFESHGFRILDMAEKNHLTYFHAQKVRILPE